jgi:hypothetical protein
LRRRRLVVNGSSLSVDVSAGTRFGVVVILRISRLLRVVGVLLGRLTIIWFPRAVPLVVLMGI